MDLDWDKIQRILTFLIIFIAPVIIAKFKNITEDDDDLDRPTGKVNLEDLVGHKPVILKELHQEHETKAEDLEKASKKAKKKKEIAEAKIKEAAAKAKKEQKKARVIAAFEPTEQKKSKAALLGMSPKKAMILKEVLGPPRGVDPY